MDYSKLVSLVPAAKWDVLSNKLVDFILTSKNDDRMPSTLARSILHQWQNNTLRSESGHAALLNAAVLLEPEKTIATLNELQIVDVAEQIKTSVKQ